MQKFIRNNWSFLLLIVLSGLIVWPLFLPGYFSHHDDLQVMRIFEMRKCLVDLQLPCRWVPDMGYGNGYPLFNFYGVFAYYVGAFLSFFMGFVGAAKALFFIPLVLGGVGMYLLAKELFGKVPGLAGGVLYLLAPYRALDAYVRGAIAELFAMTAVPFLLFFILKLIKTGRIKFFILSAITLAIFLLSHNIMTLIFSPVILVLTVFFLFENKWDHWKKVILAFAIGFGLAAFFVLPAYFEKNLVQTDALTRAELDFRAQYVKIGQLFIDRSWNYAGSNPDQNGTISYQIGWPLWWLVAIAIIPLIFIKKNRLLSSLLFMIFGLSIFMTHNKSAPIWEFFKILAYVQFPWRFLSIAIFSGSLLAGYLVSFAKGRYLYFLATSIILLAITLNWRYFKPEHFYYDVTDSSKLSGQNFIDQQKGALLDYLPKTALEPRELPPSEPVALDGKAQISNYSINSNHWSFIIETGSEVKVDVPVFDFPNWTTRVDKFKVDHKASFPTGRIELTIPSGRHEVEGMFLNTPTRRIANTISLLSLIGMLLLIKYGKNTKLFK